MKIEKELITERLRLRNERREDQDFCVSLWCDPENGTYMSDPDFDHINEKYLAALEAIGEDTEGYYFIAEEKKTGNQIGTICVFPEENQNYDIGYCIQKDHWKKGYGSEMLQAVMGFVQEKGGISITAEVADENTASVALLTKFGFHPEKKTRFKKWGTEISFDAHLYQKRLDS